MVARTAAVAAVVSALVSLLGCGDGDGDYYGQQRGGGGGPGSLDIAGTYQVTPDTFFNVFTIIQSGNNLTAVDDGGGSWSGTLTNVITEETTGPGGSTLFTWRADVQLTGKRFDFDVSLTGVVEITPTPTANVVLITARYENSLGQTGDLLLTQVSAVPGGNQQPTAGAGGGSGAFNE